MIHKKVCNLWETLKSGKLSTQHYGAEASRNPLEAAAQEAAAALMETVGIAAAMLVLPLHPIRGVGSSREVRSVSSSSHRQLQPVGDTSEDDGSEDEYESQEFYHWFPQGSNATTQLLPPPPLPPPEAGDEVLLRIPAFAQELYLLLKRDSRFLAPGFAVEERLMNERRNFPNSSQTQTERSCYYSGSVLHFPSSFASFSTCGGL
ncbi:hypothetical protein lerEdw1_000233, partial [Lerista edwardsae]